MFSFLFQLLVTVIVIFGVGGWLLWYFVRSLTAKHPGAASLVGTVLKNLVK